MRVSAALATLALALVVAPGAAAQAPPPDERAAAQALAAAAARIVAVAETLDEDPAWLEDCRALRREPPERRKDAATAVLDGLVLRDLIDQLKPAALRFRSEIAQPQTADPVLISGRAAARRLGRAIAAFPAPTEDPCAAYAAYARAGYPRGPAREARALEDRLEAIASRGAARKIDAAADRMVELGVAERDAEPFRWLAS